MFVKQTWITSLFTYQKTTDRIETMQLAHQQSSWVAGMASATEGTTSHAETSDTNDGYFKRPVKIATYAWQVGTPLYEVFNPWKQFCEDPRNINRLAHFKNLRMSLNV
jgi:hypothetical protein